MNNKDKKQLKALEISLEIAQLSIKQFKANHLGDFVTAVQINCLIAAKKMELSKVSSLTIKSENEEMSKFKIGDLVQMPNGTRLIVASFDSGDSENNDVNYWLSTMVSSGGMAYVSEEDLTLVQPAKEYIEVNGHKVPKPLSEKPEIGAEYYWANIGDYELYDISDWGSHNCEPSNSDLQRFNSGLVFDNSQDAIAMSKALLSAIKVD